MTLPSWPRTTSRCTSPYPSDTPRTRTRQGTGSYLLLPPTSKSFRLSPTNTTSIVIASTSLNLHSRPLDGRQLTKQSGSDTRGYSLPSSASCLSVRHIQPDRCTQPPHHQHRSIPVQWYMQRHHQFTTAVGSRVQMRPTERRWCCVWEYRRILPHAAGCCHHPQLTTITSERRPFQAFNPDSCRRAGDDHGR